MRPKLESISEEGESGEQLSSVLIVQMDNFSSQNGNGGSGHKINESEQQPLLGDGSRCSFLDEFVRFDLNRVGRCSTSYKISVQYEDNFMTGHQDKGTSSCLCPWFVSRRMVFRLGSAKDNESDLKGDLFSPETIQDEKRQWSGFVMEWDSGEGRDCWWWRRKLGRRCRITESGSNSVIGCIDHDSSQSPLQITLCKGKDSVELVTRKTRVGDFMIESNSAKLGMIEPFRSAHGALSSVGVSILDNELSGGEKALLIGAAVCLDVDELESSAKFTFTWVPIIVLGVILIFLGLNYGGSFFNAEQEEG